MATFGKFLPTTVFDAKFYARDADIESAQPLFVLESLKIANFTQEGPEKTARGGKNNAILARHGKTTRLEMEDAIITAKSLGHLFGAELVDSADTVETIKITDKFPGELQIKGETFFVDDSGEKVKADFVVYRFFPDGLFNLTMEAEGDFGVLEIGGEVIANNCGEFYTITAGTMPSCDED